MAYSIHLFKLARLNSEIKYVANSIVREAPWYAYHSVTNIQEWQTGVLQQLEEWASEIPEGGDNDHYIRTICQIRYHSLRMLLLRPSPAIPKPSVESLKKCHGSACQSIRLFNDLYRKDVLVHSWMTFHGLILSTITLIYCIRAVPEVAQNTVLDVLMADLGICLSILSATGEHWPGAKRSRDILDDLGRTTVQWIKDQHPRVDGAQANYQGDVGTSSTLGAGEATGPSIINGQFDTNLVQPSPWTSMMQGDEIQPVDILWPLSFGDAFGNGDTQDMDGFLFNLFEDLIPN
jgi:hypothetical protein